MVDIFSIYLKELIRARDKAKESDRLKSAFLANMSHEIRTPMNGIMGFANLLENPELNTDKQQKYLKIIQQNGQRMINTINDIIDISKIEAGQMKVHISEIDLSVKFEDLFNFFKPEADKKALYFSLKNSLSKKNCIINSDPGKIDSILSNLIKNAIKFSNTGSIEFGASIHSETNELADMAIEFYVKDTGIGIPLERQEFIFDRFVQADIEDKAAHEGSGLGLSIAKAYTEMLGGKIWLESVEGKGSVFYFTIPF